VSPTQKKKCGMFVRCCPTNTRFEGMQQFLESLAISLFLGKMENT
jgi:hypothetical protein